VCLVAQLGPRPEVCISWASKHSLLNLMNQKNDWLNKPKIEEMHPTLVELIENIRNLPCKSMTRLRLIRNVALLLESAFYFLDVDSPKLLAHNDNTMVLSFLLDTINLNSRKLSKFIRTSRDGSVNPVKKRRIYRLQAATFSLQAIQQCIEECKKLDEFLAILDTFEMARGQTEPRPPFVEQTRRLLAGVRAKKKVDY